MQIEVRFADQISPIILPLAAPPNCTLAQALDLASLQLPIKNLDLSKLNVGLNGKRIKDYAQILQEDDLIDICAPLVFDPKQRRKMKAQQFKELAK